MIYFDHNATTPLLPEARAAWLEATERFIGNPSSPHRLGSRAETALRQARESLAATLRCDALDIIWTSGATESNNAVFHHFACTLPSPAEVWVSAIEHPCMLEAAGHYFDRRLRLVPVSRGGVVDLDWLKKQLAKQRPGLIAVMAANNETGVLQPWQDIVALCRQWEVPYFCDAAQWLGKLPAAGLGECDFVSGCAHKFGGPKGAGFLKCATKGRFIPLLRGGPQESARRAGTENVAGVMAMVKALEVRERALAEGDHQARATWRNDFERELREQLPGSEIVGAEAPRLWNTTAALMPEADCQQRWVVKLDRLGFAVSTGSACSSGKEKPSHVLLAMGRSAAEASRALRFSTAWETEEPLWSQLLIALKKVHGAISVPAT
jgi:cysteine desulfurase